jgi:glycosyltransferase involved in cell wall biosynthesis
MDDSSNRVGLVAIGRNEGERLIRCLQSVRGLAGHIVYVDSGSGDGSVAAATALGARVVELDMAEPFTAARARNTGFRELSRLQPQLEYVLFVDGDCEVVAGWLERATGFLDEHPDVAIVFGQRRERYPERSVYNLLCDIEWTSAPFGETGSCGGDIVARVTAFQQVGGYRPDLIAGEEPEMCVRLRQLGWKIWHLDAPMTLHDAAIYRFGQWWKRTIRNGYAMALGAGLHGASPARHWVRESRRAWGWGLGIPLATLALVVAVGWWGLLLLAVYPLQFVRVATTGSRSRRENLWWAAAMIVGKFPEMLGQCKYVLDRVTRSRSALIEYK